MGEFKNQIAEKYELLTKAQKTVADYILQHFDSIPFFTLGDLAEKMDVSTTTVIRFARSMGYNGYSEMQTVLQDELRRKASLPNRLDSIHTIPKDDLLRLSFHNDLQNIQNTMLALPEATLNEAVNLIDQAQNVYILGMRTSYSLAHYTAICLGQMKRNVHLIQSTGMIYPEEVLGISSGDVCIAFLFPRYSHVTSTVLAWMKRQHAKIILITSTNYSAVERFSDYILPCAVSGVSLKNSYAAPMCVINYLIAALTLSNREELGITLSKAEELLRSGHNLGL